MNPFRFLLWNFSSRILRARVWRYAIALASVPLLFRSAGTVCAEPEVQIAPAVEIQYVTQVGKAYILQGALNLTNWTDIGYRVLGHGRSVRHLFPTRSDGTSDYVAYRVLEQEGPTNGFAPWSLDGGRIQQSTEGATNVVEYLDDHAGRDLYSSASDPFAYVFSRLSENDAQVERAYGPDRHDRVTYSYAGPGLGTWVREEYRLDVLERRIIGSFRYLSDATNCPPGVTNPPVVITPGLPPAPPALLTNLVYYVQSGALPDQLTFLTASTGTESSTAAGRHVEHGTANAFTYTYTVLSATTASLNINFGYYGFGGDRNEYDLTFTDGPSGTFVRRIFRLGSLVSTDSGTFSPYQHPPSPPETPGTTPDPNGPPPANPDGLTFVMARSDDPVRLVFRNPVSGVAFDDSAPSDFSYTYTPGEASKYNLVVRYKVDRWEEYDLTFTTGIDGTFVRREFKKGKLDRSDAGVFTVTLNP